jgi:D-tyrosyl-tRNA(Tyr) deacylase
MRMLLQRVGKASVAVDGKEAATIEHGFLALVGFGTADAPAAAADRGPAWKSICATLEKALALRVFPDDAGRMNRSLNDCNGSLLLVSQFTLYADCRKGRRPSFHPACPPDEAEQLFDRLRRKAEELLPGRVASGIFAALMDVTLTNRGPVTILLDSAEL